MRTTSAAAPPAAARANQLRAPKNLTSGLDDEVLVPGLLGAVAAVHHGRAVHLVDVGGPGGVSPQDVGATVAVVVFDVLHRPAVVGLQRDIAAIDHGRAVHEGGVGGAVVVAPETVLVA